MSATPNSFLTLILICIINANASHLGRIIGGVKAVPEAAPFIVSLQYNGIHNCGGSILNSHWILTAAHCLSNKNVLGSMTIVAGTNNVKELAKTTQRRSIDYYKIHEEYKGGPTPHDIGLIHANQAFEWSSAVQPINLPAVQDKTPTGFATLYGWGSTSKTLLPKYPKELQVANRLPILSYERCKKALKVLNANDDLDTSNLCTGPLREDIGACSADSGGPLVQGKESPQLIGIVSWGSVPCGQIGAPTVYVKVADFLTWIQKEQGDSKEL